MKDLKLVFKVQNYYTTLTFRGHTRNNKFLPGFYFFFNNVLNYTVQKPNELNP